MKINHVFIIGENPEKIHCTMWDKSFYGRSSFDVTRQLEGKLSRKDIENGGIFLVRRLSDVQAGLAILRGANDKRGRNWDYLSGGCYSYIQGLLNNMGLAGCMPIEVIYRDDNGYPFYILGKWEI